MGSREFLAPTWKKFCVFFFLINLFLFIFIHYFINIMTISLSILSDKANYLWKHTLIQANTTLTEEEKELETKKLIMEWSHKHSIYTQLLEKFETEDMITKIFPGGLVVCFITDEVRSNSIIVAEFERFYDCTLSEIQFFIVKLIVIYLFSCFIIWLYENYKTVKKPRAVVQSIAPVARVEEEVSKPKLKPRKVKRKNKFFKMLDV
ncbi:MAG: hypothetical protein QXQ69_00720 [Candidatus Aenigmatarchaeota archaeon]